jgi:hypothetical protein
VSEEKWDQLAKSFFDTQEMDIFTEQKAAQLEQYEQDLEKIEANKSNVDNQKMAREEFLAAHL